MQRRTLLSALAAAGATSAAPWAAAQSAWPDQPLRWVVPYPAGGGTDVLARTVAEAMRQTLGQQIVVDNRPGASTNIGGQMVATAKPDGNTFMSADNAILAYNEQQPGSSLGSRIAIRQHSIQRTLGRGWHRAIGGKQGRQLRQRASRNDQRAVQG